MGCNTMDEKEKSELTKNRLYLNRLGSIFGAKSIFIYVDAEARKQGVGECFCKKRKTLLLKRVLRALV